MTYASGFVRSYADYLGLDGEEMVRLFREEVAGMDRQVRLNFPSLATRRANSRAARCCCSPASWP